LHDQLLGVEISDGAIATIHKCWSAALQQRITEALEAAIDLLGSTFGGIVMSDRFSLYNHLPLERRQI
jgi:hypothetical protein